MLLYYLLNYFFLCTHVLIIMFALAGWMFARLRKLHLVFLMLILFSWLVLGIWFGYGYCFWTDWHSRIRQKIGLPDLPGSFVKFIFDKITGKEWNSQLIDKITLACFVAALALSLWCNWRDHKTSVP